MIYRRFTEKSAEEWRQIYKALQLLEFLIKHGSERVIDDARGHLTLLKMLRQFHFIDQNGKDQGINVRNRAKELAELLSDVDRIRTERKKARATKNKYTGVEGGAFSGGFSSNSRYGGFGSESAGYGGSSTSFGGYSGGVYGDGGGFGGQEPNDFRSGATRSERFEEYDEFDEGPTAGSSRASRRPERSSRKPAAEPPKKKEPEVDLFSFDEPEQKSVPAPAAASNGSGLADLSAPSGDFAAASNDDDEFDDFQSAAPAPAASNTMAQPLSPPVTSSAQSTAQFAAPQPQSAPQQANINQMVNMSSISPATSTTGTPGANYSAFSTPAPANQPAQQAGFKPSGPNYFGGIQAQSSGSAFGGASGMSSMAGMSGFSSTSNTAPSTMANTKPVTSPNAQPAAAPAGGDAFGALWGKASAGIKKPAQSSGPALGQLAKEKSSAGIWGTPAQQSSGGAAPQGGSASDDLLG